MDVNGKEFKRTIETVAFEESRIKDADLMRFCGRGRVQRHVRRFFIHDPYWISRKNSLELIELPCINKVCLV